jgi:hypothetical protein
MPQARRIVKDRAYFKRIGRKGGESRARKLTPEKRREIARLGNERARGIFEAGKRALAETETAYRAGRLRVGETYLRGGVFGTNSLKNLMAAQRIHRAQPLPRSRPAEIDDEAAEAFLRAIGKKR